MEGEAGKVLYPITITPHRNLQCNSHVRMGLPKLLLDICVTSLSLRYKIMRTHREIMTKIKLCNFK